MIRAEVINIVVWDGADRIEDYVPEDPADFGLHGMAFIGPEGNGSGDRFDFLACTPRWLTSARLQELPAVVSGLDATYFGTGLVVMQEWSPTRLASALNAVTSLEDESWERVAERIGQWLVWRDRPT